MARIVRRKGKKLRLEAIAGFMMTIAMISYLFTSLFIGPLNASLMINIQKMELEASLLKNENQKLAIEIQTLQNKDRIYTIAEDAGLEQNQDNIVSVSIGD